MRPVGGCRPGCSGPAHTTASSALLAGPICDLLFCKAHGDHVREAAVGTLEEHNILSVNKGVQVTELLVANYIVLGDSTALCLFILVKWDNIPHRDVL